MLFESGERFGADVVFDSLRVSLSNTFWNSQRTEERDHRFVTAFTRDGEVPSFVGEENGAVRLGGDEACFLQAGAISMSVAASP